MLPETFAPFRPTNITTEETLTMGLFWASLSFSMSKAAKSMAPDSGNRVGPFASHFVASLLQSAVITIKHTRL
jgi:hypothetical protein